MDKVTIFGAGHVGATTAYYLALSATLDIALVDIQEGVASGLAMDIEQSMPYTGSSGRLEGGSDTSLARGSDLVVITAGSPRKPGMSRLDLVDANRPVIRDISAAVASGSPDAVVIVVTNPLDEMTYLAWKGCGFEPGKVMGMAGTLDTSRFVYFLSRLASLPSRDVNAMVLGSHGDDMAPLVDWSTCGGNPLSGVVAPDVLDAVVQRTRDGGAEIVAHLQTGSAYYAPAVAIGTMALAILGDTGRVLPVSAYLRGEYGFEDIFLGVPAKLGRQGVSEVVELPLSEREMGWLREAGVGVGGRTREMRGSLDEDD